MDKEPENWLTDITLKVTIQDAAILLSACNVDIAGMNKELERLHTAVCVDKKRVTIVRDCIFAALEAKRLELEAYDAEYLKTPAGQLGWIPSAEQRKEEKRKAKRIREREKRDSETAGETEPRQDNSRFYAREGTETAVSPTEKPQRGRRTVKEPPRDNLPPAQESPAEGK